MERPVFRGTELRKVTVAGNVVIGPIRLVTVEEYADGVIVRYLVPDSGFPVKKGSRAPDHVVLALDDDVDTQYEFHSGGGAASVGGTLRGEAVYLPAVPSIARRLTITCGGDSTTVDLGDSTLRLAEGGRCRYAATCVSVA